MRYEGLRRTPCNTDATWRISICSSLGDVDRWQDDSNRAGALGAIHIEARPIRHRQYSALLASPSQKLAIHPAARPSV
jgi:hypothetical protein